MMYKLYKTNPLSNVVDAAATVDAEPNVSFVFDPANTDYQAYLQWLSEGNEPLPADEPA